MIERINPYQSPESREAVTASQRPPSSRIPFVLVTIGTIAYHGFTLLLLTSGGDKKTGLLFLLNTPILTLWMVGLWRKQQYTYILGWVAATVQIAIHGLATGGFEVNRAMMDAVLIDSFIFAAMVSLSCVCYLFTSENRRLSCGTPDNKRFVNCFFAPGYPHRSVTEAAK